MRINIGSKSPTKIQAITETLANYSLFDNCTIESLDTDSGVSDQPMSLEETIAGAKNRAKKIINNADFGFGIESGLMAVPETKTGYMNVSVCAIYDGNEYHIGLASCFEFPKEVTRLAVNEGLETSHAFKVAGLTEHEKIGYAEGGIGYLTKGRLCAAEYYKQAVVNALIHLENEELY